MYQSTNFFNLSLYLAQLGLRKRSHRLCSLWISISLSLILVEEQRHQEHRSQAHLSLIPEHSPSDLFSPNFFYVGFTLSLSQLLFSLLFINLIHFSFVSDLNLSICELLKTLFQISFSLTVVGSYS